MVLFSVDTQISRNKLLKSEEFSLDEKRVRFYFTHLFCYQQSKGNETGAAVIAALIEKKDMKKVCTLVLLEFANTLFDYCFSVSKYYMDTLLPKRNITDYIFIYTYVYNIMRFSSLFILLINCFRLRNIILVYSSLKSIFFKNRLFFLLSYPIIYLMTSYS